MKHIFVPILATIAFIVLVGLYTTGSLKLNLSKDKSPDKPQQTAIIEGKTIYLEVVDTNDSRSKGLSGKESLGADNGMLFVFPQENIIPSFWMKNMNFAIDIIWISEGKIVGIEKEVAFPEPNTSDDKLKIYKPRQSVDYVLEVNSGFSDANNFKEGSKVTLNL